MTEWQPEVTATMDTIWRKKCKDCQEFKLETEFSKGQPYCKGCRSSYRRLRYADKRSPVGMCENPHCESDATDWDHDHVTEVHRGWLCGPCNKALGLMEDDPHRLAGLIRYLTRG
jgi:hypothetical protein